MVEKVDKRKRGRPAKGTAKRPAAKSITKQERKDLQTLADDFGLLERKDTQTIIANCQSYPEGQRAIMRIYTTVYM